MRILDLCCGGGSIQKAFPEAEVVSVDIRACVNPTHCCDILTFNFRQYPRDHFDAVWCSPPCTTFSPANTLLRENQETAMTKDDRLVLRCLQIADYFHAPYFLENPGGAGRLSRRPYMADIPHCYEVTYCKYGKKYQKRTRIWTTVAGFEPKMCKHNDRCPHFQDGKHKVWIGAVTTPGVTKLSKLSDKHSVPEDLIRSLFAAAGLN